MSFDRKLAKKIRDGISNVLQMPSGFFWRQVGGVLLLLSFVPATSSCSEPRPQELSVTGPPVDCIVLPGGTSDVQLRLYTNASPEAAHLFNTFDIEGYGDLLVRSPRNDDLRRWNKESPTDGSLNNVLINGQGPQFSPTNGLRLLEETEGPEWRYFVVDASAAYRDRLEEFRRGVLFVQPGLFVVYDHLKARDPVFFRTLLHLSRATVVDEVWGDLRLEMAHSGMVVHAPAMRKQPRNWERISTSADRALPDTITLALGPTNQVAELDLLTVYCVHPTGQKLDLAFRLLLGNNAIGARIHRNGLPTLVAFRTDRQAAKASVTGFEFNGPVGVDVFKPKSKATPTRPVPE